MDLFNEVGELFNPDGCFRPEIITEPTNRILNKSLVYAMQTKWETIRTPHLFMGLLACPDKGIREWGNCLGTNLQKLLEQFRELFQMEEGTTDLPPLKLNREFCSDNVIKLLRNALLRVRQSGRYRISPMDLLVEIFALPNSIVAECFRRIGISSEQLMEIAILAEQQIEFE